MTTVPSPAGESRGWGMAENQAEASHLPVFPHSSRNENTQVTNGREEREFQGPIGRNLAFSGVEGGLGDTI